MKEQLFKQLDSAFKEANATMDGPTWQEFQKRCHKLEQAIEKAATNGELFQITYANPDIFTEA